MRNLVPLVKSCSVMGDAVPARGATTGEFLHVLCVCGQLAGPQLIT